jgi:hypothetical protein
LWRGIYLFGDDNKITNNIISGNLTDMYGDEGIEMEGKNNIFLGNIITKSDEALDMNQANNNQINSKYQIYIFKKELITLNDFNF